jgi:hypothetical protein
MIFSKILHGYALDSQEPFSKPARLSSPKVESDRLQQHGWMASRPSRKPLMV